MSKVAVTIKISKELKADFEEKAKAEGKYLSGYIAEQLEKEKNETGSFEKEISRLLDEIANRDKRLDDLTRLLEKEQKLVENMQEMKLYEERQKTIQLEMQQDEMKQIAVNDSKNEKETNEEKEEKRGWFKWFKRT